MNKNMRIFSSRFVTPRGFTLVELLVVVSLLGIIAAIAMPSFIAWRENVKFREAARNMGAALRVARQEAITKNRQHSVEVDAANRRYRFGSGNAAWNSVFQYAATLNHQAFIPDALWNTVPIPPTATIFANTQEIRFSPNGTATFNNPAVPAAVPPVVLAADPPTGAVLIRDNVGVNRFAVVVTSTGRIQVRRGPF